MEMPKEVWICSCYGQVGAYYTQVMGDGVKYIPASALSDLTRENETLRKELEKARELLKALVDDEPCRYDHHGYCQTRRLEENCSNAQGKAFLEDRR